jgi:hypothetical protein
LNLLPRSREARPIGGAELLEAKVLDASGAPRKLVIGA